MRFGHWRGVTLAIALLSAIGASTASAAGLDTLLNPHPVIPRVAPAVDYRTGGEYHMPPVPYGCYAKDPLGAVGGAIGTAKGLLCGACNGLGCGLCKGILGNTCGACGGAGCGLCKGGGLFHGKHGQGHVGNACGANGCGVGGGLFHGKHGQARGDAGCGIAQVGGGAGLGFAQVGGPHHHGNMGSVAIPSSQTIVSPQGLCGSCGGAGCGLCKGGLFRGGPGHGSGKGGLFHGRNKGCGACGGSGCGLCRGGGLGLGHGGACGACGGSGCGLCKGGHGGACGGAGCGLCSKVHGALGMAHGLLYSALHPHAGKIDYFVGAGGPVPLTPGYVPYVVPVRSPRDFLAFPPYGPIDP